MSKAEKTKQYIIEKTAPIFNKKGYAGTSLNDMMASTGLTKGSIYGNFSNKDEVALAAFNYNLERVANVLRAEVQKQETVKEKLLVYPRVYENFMRPPFPDGGCPILNTAIEADDTHSQLKARAATAIIVWKNSIERLVEKGIQNKELKKDVNVEQVALTIIAMIEGGIMITKLTGKNTFKKSVMSSVVAYIESISR